MHIPEEINTYVAIVYEDGTDKEGNDLTNRGWFAVDDPVKDENGERFWWPCVANFRFVAGGGVNLGVPVSDIRDNNGCVADRVTIVLARQPMVRWHHI